MAGEESKQVIEGARPGPWSDQSAPFLVEGAFSHRSGALRMQFWVFGYEPGTDRRWSWAVRVDALRTEITRWWTANDKTLFSPVQRVASAPETTHEALHQKCKTLSCTKPRLVARAENVSPVGAGPIGGGEHKVGAPPWSPGPDPLDPRNHASPPNSRGVGVVPVSRGG